MPGLMFDSSKIKPVLRQEHRVRKSDFAELKENGFTIISIPVYNGLQRTRYKIIKANGQKLAYGVSVAKSKPTGLEIYYDMVNRRFWITDNR